MARWHPEARGSAGVPQRARAARGPPGAAARHWSIRIPLWAGNVVLTLHVVTHLHRSYGAAGLLAGAGHRGARDQRPVARPPARPARACARALAAVAGRADRVLERRAVRRLLAAARVLASVAGLFIVPVVLHRAAGAASTRSRRVPAPAALSIDSVVVEISFMIGPALGVLLATYWPTRGRCSPASSASVAGGIVLWLADPPLRPAADGSLDAAASGEHAAHPAIRSWMTPAVLAVLAMSAAAMLVLTGTDVGVVAALRAHAPPVLDRLGARGLGARLGRRRRWSTARCAAVCRCRSCWRCWPAPRCRSSSPATPVLSSRSCCSSPACSARRRSPPPSTRCPVPCPSGSAARRWAGTARR